MTERPFPTNEVYDILVSEFEALESNRDSFVRYMTETNRYGWEFRFMGTLGFGGKFYRDKWEHRWYVDCYAEDATPELREQMERVNEQLAELCYQWRFSA